MRKLCGLMVALCVLLPVFGLTVIDVSASGEINLSSEFGGPDIGKVSVMLNGVFVEASGISPVIYNGNILMSAYDIAENFEFDLQWERGSDEVVLKSGEFIVSIVAGGGVSGNSNYTWDNRHFGPRVNGSTLLSSVHFQVVNGVPMLPVRWVLESTGHMVDWYEAERMVVVVDYVPGVRYYFKDVGISVAFPAWLDGEFEVVEWVDDSAAEWLIDGEWVNVGVKVSYIATINHIGSLGFGGGHLFSFIREEGEHELYEPPMINAEIIMHAGGYTFYVLRPRSVEHDETPGSVSARQYDEFDRVRYAWIINSIRLLPSFADS